MKIYRVKETNKDNLSWKDRIFLNIRDFFRLYRFIALLIAIVAFAIFILLFLGDLIAPNELKSIDKKTTLALFDQLQEENRHQDAIQIMEYKGNEFLENSPIELEYKLKLSDSYIHIGDYSKAEKMLLDVENHAHQYLSSLKKEDPNEYQKYKNFLYFSITRPLYQFYEITGDISNQIKYYNKYKLYFNNCSSELSNMIRQLLNEEYGASSMSVNVEELIEYDDIIIISFEDKKLAIKKMANYIDKISQSNNYGKAFFIKCLNKLIGWQLDLGLLPQAYKNIKRATEIAMKIHNVREYCFLGELSDYCYKIHDIETSKKLYIKYQRYLDKYFEDSDLEYLTNYIRSFRYLEADEEWDELTEQLTEYCKGMKHQILLNLPSMTEEQREYFVKEFDVAYNYTIHLLQMNPNQELANLCFDNITFRNGLLLRSNRSIENSIKKIGSENLDQKYKELKECRLNLIYQSVSSNIFTNESKLKNRINELEKEIAIECTDFKTKNQTPDNSYLTIQDKITANEAIVDLVEHEGDLFALVLLSEQNVHYIPIGKSKDIESILKQPIEVLYHNTQLTDKIWNPISDVVGNRNDIYYLPIGMFSQISLGTLCVNDKKNEYLFETKSLHLISNHSDIITGFSTELLAETNNVSLWGGIDYGTNTSDNNIVQFQKRKAIKRGDKLINLQYAFFEVKEIAEMLENNKISKTLYTKEKATESAFKKRSGKGDNIIHISTHGFFHNDVDYKKAMYESGLFFAGANKYWCSDSLNLNSPGNDGILRGEEIAELDLSGCELVVLSACETGLGVSKSDEGVYGLQRAFKLAGAKRVLMSLWDVDDNATTLLMTEFYKNYLSGMTMEQALDESKKMVRQIHPSPEYWGAFVLLN